MGLSIGQTPAALIASQAAAIQRPRSSADTTDPPPDLVSSKGGPAENLFKREPKPENPGAGFGRNTVSGPAAAVVTLTRGVEAVVETIPTVEEVRARQRRAAQERQDQLDERVREAADERRVEVRIPDASAQARKFINTIDETARRVDARLGGREPEAVTRRAIEVNGETLPIAADTSRPGQRINFRA